METRKSPTVSQLMNSHFCFQQKHVVFREKKHRPHLHLLWQKKTHIMLIGPPRHQLQFILSKRRHGEWPGWVFFFPTGKSNVEVISYQKDSKVPQNKSCKGRLLVATFHIPWFQNIGVEKNDGWKLEGRFFPFWTRWAVTNFENEAQAPLIPDLLEENKLTPRQQHPPSFLTLNYT